MSKKHRSRLCVTLKCSNKEEPCVFCLMINKIIDKPKTYPATVVKLYIVHQVVSRNDQAAISIIIPSALGLISGIY